MSPHVGERAMDLVLGLLGDDEARALEAHAAGCALCQAELRAAAEDFEAASLALPPISPSPAVLRRLEASVAPLAERIGAWLSRLASLADLSEEKMAGIVAALDVATTWFPGPADGIDVAHVDAGPAVAGAIVGFIRVAAGGSFPEHTHLGEERMLVVQGRYRDSVEGKVYGPGDQSTRAADTTHELLVLDEELIYLFVVEGGLTMAEQTLGPDDPNI